MQPLKQEVDVPQMPTMSAAAEAGQSVSNVGSEDNNTKFLMAVFAMAQICNLKGEEKPKSMRHNRCVAAEENILKICDMYVPSGINSTCLNKVWEILDGPVADMLRKHKDDIFAAIDMAVQTTQEDSV